MKLGALLALALVAAALVLVAQSCGGGPRRLTYPEFQQQANAICRRYRSGLARLGPPTSLPRIAAVAQGAYRLGAVERRELRRLRPPADAADAYARMLDRFAKADALLLPLRRAALKGDAGTAQALAGQGRELVAAANRDATALGLLDCRRT